MSWQKKMKEERADELGSEAELFWDRGLQDKP